MELNTEHSPTGAILLSLWDTVFIWRTPVARMPGEATETEASVFPVGNPSTESPSDVHWAPWQLRNDVGGCGSLTGILGLLCSLIKHVLTPVW